MSLTKEEEEEEENFANSQEIHHSEVLKLHVYLT